MSFDLDTLKKLVSDRVLLFCHLNTDPDCICSAYAFKELVNIIKPATEVRIILTGGASNLSKIIIETLGIKTVEEMSINTANVLIILDTPTLRQLGDWEEKIAKAETPKIFVDHHAPLHETQRLTTLLFVDENASSTCEIIYNLYRKFGVTPSSVVARALLIGIAFDSKHFTIGKAKMFRVVSELLELDGTIEEVLSLLRLKSVRSERIARLKACQRMQMIKVEDWILTTSYISSFQASAARGLISLGADISVVAGINGGRARELRVSLRATDRFYSKTSIHLGRDIAIPLGKEFNGVGSGHPTSAGINAEGDYLEILRRAVELFSDKILNNN